MFATRLHLKLIHIRNPLNNNEGNGKIKKDVTKIKKYRIFIIGIVSYIYLLYNFMTSIILLIFNYFNCEFSVLSLVN